MPLNRDCALHVAWATPATWCVVCGVAWRVVRSAAAAQLLGAEPEDVRSVRLATARPALGKRAARCAYCRIWGLGACEVCAACVCVVGVCGVSERRQTSRVTVCL